MDISAHPGPRSAADPIWLRIVGSLLAIVCAYAAFYTTAYWGAGSFLENVLTFILFTVILSLGAYGPIVLFAYGAAEVHRRRSQPTCPAGNCPLCRYEWTGIPGSTCPECGRVSTAEQRQSPVRLPIKRWIVRPVMLGVLLGGLFSFVWLGIDRAAFQKECVAYFGGGGTGHYVRSCRWPASWQTFASAGADGPIGLVE